MDTTYLFHITHIIMYTNWHLPSFQLNSRARSYCSVQHRSTSTPMGTCRHPDYIRERGHIVVNIIMSTNWHLPSSRLYSGARSYCRVQHTSICNIQQHVHQSASAIIPSIFGGEVILQCTTYINMHTDWHLPLSWLFSGARSYWSEHNYVHQSAPAVIPTQFQGEVIL